MRNRLPLFFLLLLLCLPSVLADDMRFTVAPDLVRPGKIERISFFVPSDGEADLLLLDELSGETRAVIRRGIAAAAGDNHLAWDGRAEDGAPVAPGAYLLALTMGSQGVTRPLTVGEESPQITSLSAPDSVSSGEAWAFSLEANLPGLLTVRLRPDGGSEWTILLSLDIAQGRADASWDGLLHQAPAAEGRYDVQFFLTDAEGFTGTARQISLAVNAPAQSASPVSPDPSPAPASADAPVKVPSAAAAQADGSSYWTLPIGVFDEAAIWNVMMQPSIVIDGKDQRDVYPLRRTPDNSAAKENIVGEITYTSQGVHVLETRDDGWSQVEAYNSSYGPDCASRRGYGVTDDLIQGYVKTSLLKTITPRTDYALLIDKCEQRMYIFSEGACIGTLLVSTGLNNAKQSWNETPAGEFLMVSRMGGFPAGNLWCAYGMRINGGCAIHEVPYIGNKDTPAANRDYSSTVKMLGQKASHGCIRVQKAANEQGQNIKWLWDNIRVNTKVIIWDDTGRTRPYPAPDDYELYYNPNGGQYYHENQNCPSVKSRFLPLTAFSYGELDTGVFAKLTPCPKCASIMRKSQIDAMNALAAE